MNIRGVQRQDLDQVITLCQLHAAYEKAAYDSSHKADFLSKHIFENASVQCLVVEMDTELVGYATFMKQFSTWEADFYIKLDCLYLKEKARGKGLGSRLVERVIEYAKKENCLMVQWQTPSFNEKAIRFYQKMGGISQTKERFFLPI